MMRFRFRGAAAVPKAFPVMIRTVGIIFPEIIPGAPIVAVLGIGASIFLTALFADGAGSTGRRAACVSIITVFFAAYCAFCLFGAGRRAAGMSNRIIRIIIRTLIVCTSIMME